MSAVPTQSQRHRKTPRRRSAQVAIGGLSEGVTVNNTRSGVLSAHSANGNGTNERVGVAHKRTGRSFARVIVSDTMGGVSCAHAVNETARTRGGVGHRQSWLTGRARAIASLIPWRGIHSDCGGIHGRGTVPVNNLVLHSGCADRKLDRLARSVAHAIDDGRHRALQKCFWLKSASALCRGLVSNPWTNMRTLAPTPGTKGPGIYRHNQQAATQRNMHNACCTKADIADERAHQAPIQRNMHR